MKATKLISTMSAILIIQNGYCSQSDNTIKDYMMTVEDYQSGINQNLKIMEDERGKLAICLEFNSQMADLNIDNMLSFKQLLDIVSQADLAKNDVAEKIWVDSENIKWSVDIQRKNIAYMKVMVKKQQAVLRDNVQWRVDKQLDVLNEIESIGLRHENRYQEEIPIIERLCSCNKQWVVDRNQSIDEQVTKIKLAISKINQQVQIYKEIDLSKML